MPGVGAAEALGSPRSQRSANLTFKVAVASEDEAEGMQVVKLDFPGMGSGAGAVAAGYHPAARVECVLSGASGLKDATNRLSQAV